MANITFNNTTTGFNMWPDEVMPQSVDRQANHLYILTPNKYGIVFAGGPFTYDGNGVPVSGTVARVYVTFPDVKPIGAPDLDITNLNVDIRAYASLLTAGGTAAEKTTAFWTATLSGNDTINFGANATNAGFSINFGGDGSFAPSDAVGGNDAIRGDAGDGIVTGDYFTVLAGRTAFGGNDDIRLVKSNGSAVIGDFANAGTSARVFGGDDYIALGDSGGLAYGDVGSLQGVLQGGDDTMIGGAGSDQLVGDVARAYDTASFKGGDDEIHGGAGSDVIYGDYGYATGATSVGGNDRLYGDAGLDTIFGNDGADYLDGGADADFLSGGGGSDVLRGGSGIDTVYGGDGVDMADYSDKSQKVVVTLDANGGGPVKVNGVVEDMLDSIENIVGGSAGDRLTGYAAQHDNRFEGRGGNDTLDGAAGNDTLVGGNGKDRLIGGADADQFVFNTRPGSTNVDKIVDFVHGTDEIVLDDAILKALGPSFEKNEFVAKAHDHFATKKAQHVIYDKSEGSLWYDVDGKGGKAAIKFAQIGTEDSHPRNISWDDFAIV